MTEPLLKVENLNVTFTNYGRTRQVLRDVAFTVSAGERVALIGETGSGKSVTAKAIIGTLPKNATIASGAIVIDGRDVLAMPRREREALKGTAFSLIMQDPLSSFNPVFKIGTHLDDVMRFADKRNGINSSKAERRTRIAAVLRRVQLGDTERVMNAYPSELSGGMRQRVLIGLALLHQPKLLIADEPGTALDVTTQDEILNLINQLVAEENMALLMITHNLGVVRKVADRVVVMHHGDIVETGPCTQILHAPVADYTRSLLDAVPPLYGPRVADLAQSTRSPIVTIEGLNKIYGRRNGYHAVRDVNLTLKDGEIFGLAGESGSGKTSVARMIMGLSRPTSGNLVIDAPSPGRGKRLTQIVYQNPGTSLNPKRTVRQTLTLPLKSIGMDGEARERRMQELMGLVRLPQSYLGKYPHELSGGQKQRVAIARALAAEPKILILDEPTAALDVSVQKTVIDLLLQLREELGLTYLMISHDLSLMRNFCSRIAIMLRGEIVEEGVTSAVFAEPKHPYTRALIAAIPVVTDEEERLKPTVTEEERMRFLVKTTD
ncbi:peptide/nickel transport system ATP-binding protein [Agrobacterium tumefaciens]|uniref:ATP-binding cassette domain-containing protein n=1 Tax=Agrobacterium tumefaciens TaxID=358 RepID=UPI000B3F6D51|nr:ABC transporter ATP-binding protein [Agrobacterium tumefaciens]MBP2508962.1 peptide/nickel transport system ATP-binding protein [Agrobacterium tumefaciens]MBP2518114.1 peptide/nickel transport system ATP-binding protein [Agrobacterium tumefaciens]MBP2576747.1 peptide/nickel transport system ATP-binding protein [Agrobacterium tumefaciens]MBP2595071.1 peptide/nickel transport system ATP-binding protein [Agrobacterium tumefaciens]NSY02960.1 ABC transporter ATP-binding protein [Agrobacterium tu